MYCVGIDIGGMSIKAGVVDENGKIVKHGRVVTDVDGGAEKIADDIAGLIASLADISDPEFVGVGVGSPGAIDSAHGIVNRAYNLKWTDVPLADMLCKRLGNKPVNVSNDANVAALGETVYGAVLTTKRERTATKRKNFIPNGTGNWTSRTGSARKYPNFERMSLSAVTAARHMR